MLSKEELQKAKEILAKLRGDREYGVKEMLGHADIFADIKEDKELSKLILSLFGGNAIALIELSEVIGKDRAGFETSSFFLVALEKAGLIEIKFKK